MNVQEKVNALKLRIRAQKGHMTRNVKAAERLCQFVRGKPSSIASGQLIKSHENLQESMDKIVGSYTELMGYSPEDVETIEGKLAELESIFTETSEKLMAAANEIDVPPQPNLETPPTGQSQQMKPQVNGALKPSVLNDDYTPVEMRAWVSQFKAFYSTSNMAQCTVEDQQAYLKICVDLNLYLRLSDKVSPTTEIFGEGGCIDLIKEEFLNKYPLFSRRLDFFRLKKKKEESQMDYIARLKILGEEADLDDLSVDDLYVFRIICECSDSYLRDKYLKIEDPSLDDLMRITRAHEVARAAQKALDTNKVNYAGNSKKKFFKTKETRVTKESLKGRCFCCGSSTHLRNDCKKKHLTCNKCKKQGHIAPVCLSGEKSESASASNSRPGSTVVNKSKNVKNVTKAVRRVLREVNGLQFRCYMGCWERAFSCWMPYLKLQYFHLLKMMVM